MTPKVVCTYFENLSSKWSHCSRRYKRVMKDAILGIITLRIISRSCFFGGGDL